MAKVFEFKDYNLELNIAGKEFRINCNSNVGDKMQAFSKNGKVMVEQLRAGEKTSEDALQYCAEAIDGILGAGAFEKIFEGRKATVTDCSDVLIFLSQEIAATNRSQKEAAMNREQRRAAAKSK